MPTAKLFSLEKQFHFYKSYHSHAINKRIHMVFIPVLFVTFLMLFSTITLPRTFLNLSHLVVFAYIFYCIILNPQIGLFFTPVILILYGVSQWLVRYAGPSGAVPWALAFNFIAWFAQIVGHYGFEKNSPAFMDSLVQSVLAAPVVIYLEVMFSLGMFQETKTKLQRSRVVARARKSLKGSS